VRSLLRRKRPLDALKVIVSAVPLELDEHATAALGARVRTGIRNRPDIVKRSRSAQGLPNHVRDPDTLHQIAQILPTGAAYLGAQREPSHAVDRRT